MKGGIRWHSLREGAKVRSGVASVLFAGQILRNEAGVKAMPMVYRLKADNGERWRDKRAKNNLALQWVWFHLKTAVKHSQIMGSKSAKW